MSTTDERISERVAEHVEHTCNLYCAPDDGIHADVLWSNEPSLETMLAWMVNQYGDTLVSLAACEAPPLETIIAGEPEAVFAEINGATAALPVSAFRYAYLFRYYATLVSS